MMRFFIRLRELVYGDVETFKSRCFIVGFNVETRMVGPSSWQLGKSLKFESWLGCRQQATTTRRAANSRQLWLQIQNSEKKGAFATSLSRSASPWLLPKRCSLLFWKRSSAQSSCSSCEYSSLEWFYKFLESFNVQGKPVIENAKCHKVRRFLTKEQLSIWLCYILKNFRWPVLQPLPLRKTPDKIRAPSLRNSNLLRSKLSTWLRECNSQNTILHSRLDLIILKTRASAEKAHS